jgi:hypothetical protein
MPDVRPLFEPMHHRTLWSISRNATVLVAVVASLAAVGFVLALIALPATPANAEATLVLGPFTVLPLATLVLSAGLLISCVAVFTLHSWGRIALVGVLKVVGFASVLVLVFFAVLMSQPGALTASLLAFAAPSIAAFVLLSAASFGLAHFFRRSPALRINKAPTPDSGVAA